MMSLFCVQLIPRVISLLGNLFPGMLHTMISIYREGILIPKWINGHLIMNRDEGRYLPDKLST